MRARVLATVLLLLPFTVVLSAVAGEEATKDEGQDLYQKKCALCHGANGVAKPTGKGSANFNDPEWQKATSDEAIAKVTLEGRNKMPKYEGKLTKEQIQAIIAEIRKLK